MTAAPRLLVADLPRRGSWGSSTSPPTPSPTAAATSTPTPAIAHGLALAAAGAAVIDVGGESTRPGADPVAADEELRRVLPVVAGAGRAHGGAASASTRPRPLVATAALDAGAAIVNDVSGGDGRPRAARRSWPTPVRVVRRRCTCAARRARCSDAAHYDDVVARGRRRAAGAGRRRASRPASTRARCSPIRASVSPRPPNTTSHCCARCPRSRPGSACRSWWAPSRKSFLARIVGDDDRAGRDDATLATTVWCFEQGAALVRVHDVAGSRRAVELLEMMERATPEGMAA